jgi:hypothetical protein
MTSIDRRSSVDENRQPETEEQKSDYGHEKTGSQPDMGQTRPGYGETGTSEQVTRTGDEGTPNAGGESDSWQQEKSNPSVTDESGSWQNKRDETQESR